MPVPFFFSAPTATIIGTDSSSQLALCGFLTQLGFCHVETSASWKPLQAEDQKPVSTLYFVGWEQWGPETLQWIARLKTFGKEPGTAKFLLIIPNDYSLNRVAAIQGGVDGFISYPYSLSNLRQKIQAILPALAMKAPAIPIGRKQKKAPSQESLTGGRSHL